MNLAGLTQNSARPIINWSKCPAWVSDNNAASFTTLGGGLAGYTQAYDTADRAVSYGRTLVTTLTSAGNWGRRWSPGSVNTNGGKAPHLRMGQKVSFGFWIKASQAANITLCIEYSDSSHNYAGGLNGSTIALNPGVWTLIKADMACNTLASVYFRTFGFLTQSAPTGFEFKLGPSIAVIDSEAPLEYADGDTPGWKWLATPHESASVGYAYTLESIAGKPLNDLKDVTPGTQIAIAAGTNITIYQVCSDATPTGTQGIFEGYDNAGLRVMRSMFDYNAGTHIIAELSNATDAYPLSLGGASEPWLTQGKNIAASSWAYQNGAFSFLMNGGNFLQRPHNSSKVYRGLATLKVGTRDNTANADLITDRFLVYGSVHGEQTMRQVQAWLARKYNAPIPTGY